MASAADIAAAKTAAPFPAPPSIDDLYTRLQELKIAEPLEIAPGAQPTSNPVDIFRCYIAKELSQISGVSLDLVYPALEWTKSMEQGDLILAVPRLRVKGAKPDELAKEWASKVRLIIFGSRNT